MKEKEKNITKQQLSILMANALIHFDNALYGYLVPILAPLFFPKSNHVAQLIWGYMPFVASFLAKPLGLFFFSKMAQNGKEIVALRYTLLGIGSSLLALGSLPTYETASLWTISWLLLARICGEACAAGEHTIAKMYLIKGITTQPAKKLAAWYEGSSMVGILGAGAASSCLAWLPHPHLYWRIPFLTAAAATLFNVVFFRLKHTKISEHHQPIAQKSSPFLQLWQARTPIMRIAIVAGFGYMAYTIPFLFISSFVPIVTTITYSAMMQHLPIFMLLDIACIGWIAKVGQKADHNNLMAVASGLMALSIIPLFAGLPGASFFYVTMVRCWLIFLGVVFSCFLAIWSKEQVTESSPYLTIGLATVLGTSLLGKSAPALCFYLFHTYNSPIAPACYIALLAFAATLIMADSASS